MIDVPVPCTKQVRPDGVYCTLPTLATVLSDCLTV